MIGEIEMANPGFDHQMPNKLLRAGDVAQRLNISRALAYRLMQSGAMPTIRINRSVRVRAEDLESYILHCRVTPADAWG